VAVICGALALAPVPSHAAGSLPPVHHLKAAYLLHFAKFVEWPPAARAGRTTVDVCVLGDDALHRAVEAAARDETIAAKRVAAARLAAPHPIDRCHVLFVADGFHDDMELMLPVAHRAHVLLVGDGSAFLLRGGAIAFAYDDSRLRFDLDLRAAARAGLKVQSKLVKVARQVTPRDGA